jgi:hypothetical protein
MPTHMVLTNVEKKIQLTVKVDSIFVEPDNQECKMKKYPSKDLYRFFANDNRTEWQAETISGNPPPNPHWLHDDPIGAQQVAEWFASNQPDNIFGMTIYMIVEIEEGISDDYAEDEDTALEKTLEVAHLSELDISLRVPMGSSVPMQRRGVGFLQLDSFDYCCGSEFVAAYSLKEF